MLSFLSSGQVYRARARRGLEVVHRLRRRTQLAVEDEMFLIKGRVKIDLDRTGGFRLLDEDEACHLGQLQGRNPQRGALDH